MATRPTDVSLILDYLVELDDFASKGMIAAATDLPMGRVRAGLANLLKFKCIDAVSEGGLVMFFQTKHLDTRTFVAKFTQEGIKRKVHERHMNGRTPWHIKYGER